MTRFIEGCDRGQRQLLPDCVDDYVGEDSPVRVVDVFVDELDMGALGFAGAAATGRPGYHPATLLKLYLYGYLNQVQSSRRLEREAGPNIECMWLTGKLAPDFKTIADFRRDNGEAIRSVCRQFIVLCRDLGLIAGGTVAVDGSRFRAVNSRDRNFTPGVVRRRIEQVEASIQRYLEMLDTADRQEDGVAEIRTLRLGERLEALRRQMRDLQAMEEALARAPDRQISQTDPDARAMATNGKGTGLVGYNLQAAVDTEHHLIVAHEVTNVGHDLRQLANMGRQAKIATGAETLTVLADRGYYSGEEVLACEVSGITPICPKPLTSGAKAEGRWGKQDFRYEPGTDTYHCPAGEQRPGASRQWKTDRRFTPTGPIPAGPAQGRSNAPPARNVGSSAGSTSTSSRRCRPGLSTCLTPCACDGERSSTSLAPSRTGWAEATSRQGRSSGSKPR